MTWVDLVLCGSETVQTLYCSLHSVAGRISNFVANLAINTHCPNKNIDIYTYPRVLLTAVIGIIFDSTCLEVS
jgi:hypothetical protein